MKTLYRVGVWAGFSLELCTLSYGCVGYENHSSYSAAST